MVSSTLNHRVALHYACMEWYQSISSSETTPRLCPFRIAATEIVMIVGDIPPGLTLSDFGGYGMPTASYRQIVSKPG